MTAPLRPPAPQPDRPPVDVDGLETAWPALWELLVEFHGRALAKLVRQAEQPASPDRPAA